MLTRECIAAVQGEKLWGLMEKVEESDRWPQQACTTMFFLIPKTVSSERPIALMPTLIRWWEALRAPEVAKWQQRYRVGGAQQAVWGDFVGDGKIPI